MGPRSELRLFVLLLAALPLMTGCGGCGSKPPAQGLSRPSEADEFAAPAVPKMAATADKTASTPAAAAPGDSESPASMGPTAQSNRAATAPPRKPGDIPNLPPASSIVIEPVDASWTAEQTLEQSVLRLKKISLALREHAVKEKRFPPRAICDIEQAPLLSWRVLLLPYLGHAELFAKFRLDEAWNSPANVAAAKEIPPVYQSPLRSDGYTVFLAPVSPKTLFSGEVGVPAGNVTDEWSDTIEVVMVDDSYAVQWTQPADLDLRRSESLTPLLAAQNGLLAAFADAEVRWIPGDLPSVHLYGMLSMSGREQVLVADRTREPSAALPSFTARVASRVSPAAAVSASPPASETPVAGALEEPSISVKAVASDHRLPLPDADEAEKAAALLKQVFHEEIEWTMKGDAKRSKHHLATTLMNNAQKVEGDAAAYYVLLQTARDNAAAAGDYKLALKAADALIVRYQVNDYVLCRRTVLEASRSLLPYFEQQSEELRKDVAKVLKQALQNDDFAAADELAGVLLECTRRKGDRWELLRVQAAQKEVGDIKKAYQAVSSARQVLAASPDDPDANYTLGVYLCLVKHRWDEGRPMLAKGSNLRLKVLANEELRTDLDTRSMTQLADEYWALADTESSLFKRGLHMRAVYWYQLALPRLANSLTKVQTERRIAEANKSYGEALVKDCLALMKANDTVQVGRASTAPEVE